ncbi:ATP synthase subunit 9, mitochondrial [Silene latifolia]|uniref:ATP synthase subunit 9, mitochondrial n=1 Tax=Silene latifolia TaxID=37657 RepID=UPI003D784330
MKCIVINLILFNRQSPKISISFVSQKTFLSSMAKRILNKNFLIMLEGAKSIGAGAATIASAGAAVGIGNVFSSLIHSVARNPSLAKQLFGYAILGFALTEAIALFALMMAFLISFVF